MVIQGAGVQTAAEDLCQILMMLSKSNFIIFDGCNRNPKETQVFLLFISFVLIANPSWNCSTDELMLGNVTGFQNKQHLLSNWWWWTWHLQQQTTHLQTVDSPGLENLCSQPQCHLQSGATGEMLALPRQFFKCQKKVLSLTVCLLLLWL